MNTLLDAQSKKKAYTLMESGLLDSMKPGTVKGLQQIHAWIMLDANSSVATDDNSTIAIVELDKPCPIWKI